MTDLVVLCHSLPQAVFGDVDWLQSFDGTLHRDVLAPQVLCTSAVVTSGSMCFIHCAGVQGCYHGFTITTTCLNHMCGPSRASFSHDFNELATCFRDSAPGLERYALVLPRGRQAELHCQHCCLHSAVAHALRRLCGLQRCALPGADAHQQCTWERRPRSAHSPKSHVATLTCSLADCLVQLLISAVCGRGVQLSQQHLLQDQLVQAVPAQLAGCLTCSAGAVALATGLHKWLWGARC